MIDLQELGRLLECQDKNIINFLNSESVSDWVKLHYTQEFLDSIDKELHNNESALLEYIGNYSKVINDYVRKGTFGAYIPEINADMPEFEILMPYRLRIERINLITYEITAQKNAHIRGILIVGKSLISHLTYET